jgi:predicted peptidase
VARNNAITNEFELIEKEQKITENDLVKLISEAVQTGPLKKTHGTQMTPYDSEASEISCIFYLELIR